MSSTVSNRPMPEPGQNADAPQRPWRRASYIAESFEGADDALAALEAIQGGLLSTGFQTLDWLVVLFEELAAAQDVMPRLVVVTECRSGAVALALPLLIENSRYLRIARFADLGVADYGAPILGPAALGDAQSMRQAWSVARAGLRDVDLIRLERMPHNIGDRPNPLAMQRGAVASRQTGNVALIVDTVDAFIAARGTQFRQETARCMRLLEKAGRPQFYCAKKSADIARAFSVFDDRQSARSAPLGGNSVLDKPEYRAFYERIVMDGSDAGLSHLFALEAGGEIVATLFGIVHDGAFTLLKVSDGGEKWRHLSPDRLILIEAMRYLADRGVKRIDMGIGSNRLKTDFDAEEIPLGDLIVARRLVAAPLAILERTKSLLRSAGGIK